VLCSSCKQGNSSSKYFCSIDIQELEQNTEKLLTERIEQGMLVLDKKPCEERYKLDGPFSKSNARYAR
jgi:hypothetical protein